MTIMKHKFALGLASAAVLAGGGIAAAAAPTGAGAQAAETARLALTPSSDQLAACMPGAKVTVKVQLRTDTIGFDVFHVDAQHLAPNRSFTVFLLEEAGAPFGAAEYIGDITTNAAGKATNDFKLIVAEGFSSTLVNGTRTRVDLNRVGMWFADPADDDFCLGANSPVTPFDGDNEAGVQAFNSANAEPLPAP
jgi:hypothetical protein